MSILTPFFNLIKPAKTDPTAIAQINSNMDVIDTEMHRPPLTVNEIEPDPETRNIPITTVPLADNLTSDEAQINQGTYIIRTSGGEASIADGSAWLSDLRGNMVKTGYVPESLNMTVTPVAREEGEEPITATIDRDTFVAYVTESGTITLTYTSEWSADPALYGITVDGTPVGGDQIVVVYVKENRGTITTATPSSFVSTGWNLYNHSAGYAHVVNYSSEYGFMIEGTYTALKFAETLSGEQVDITPVDGYFTIPAESGYVFVTGGNATDTEIWMTWSDWTEEANGGVFEAYSQTTIDLSGVMVDFPYGLMRIGNTYDEINLNTLRAYSRIERMSYTAENLAGVIASGVPYDTDANYIYAVRVAPATFTISLSGEYTCSDHGIEMFVGTSIPVTASSLYGNDLKGKLRRDVLTISQQTLTAAQKSQVKSNLGFANQTDLDALNSNVATSSDFVLSDFEAVKTKLEELASNLSAGQSKLVRICYTGTYTQPMKQNIRYMGYLTKSYSGKFYSWDAYSYTGYDVHFSRDGDSLWHIYSLGNPVDLTVDYTGSAFSTHNVAISRKTGRLLHLCGYFSNTSNTTGKIATIKNCYPVTSGLGSAALPVQCDDNSVKYINFETDGTDLVLKCSSTLTANNYVRFNGVIDCSQ